MTSDSAKGTEGYQIFSLAESARAKGMWAGALERTPIPGLSGLYAADPPGGSEAEEPPLTPNSAADSSAANQPAPDSLAPNMRIREIGRPHTPALLKIIDEALVNASDHLKEHAGAPRAADRVTRIALTFDRATGEFVVENDGPGIPVVVHAQASAAAGHDVYVPEVAFAHFLAGRNMEKSPDSVKGGINGIGAKLINVHSERFTVETVGADASGAAAVYVQTFRDRMRVREPPAVAPARGAAARALLPAAERRRPHTRVAFVPAYAALGYASPPAAADADDLEAWCRWRVALLAAYAGPRAAVLFQGARAPTTSAKALAALAVAGAPGAVVLGLAARAPAPPQAAHPWDLAVAVVPGARRFAHLSVVNGVHCAKGTHITYFKRLLADAVGARLARATKARGKGPAPADACRNVFLVAVGALPGADWGGQRKDELQVAEAKLRPYAVAAAPLGRAAGAVADALLQEAETAVRGRRKKVAAEKYTRARAAGTRDSARCALLAAEGDSAITLLRAGLTLKGNPGGPTFEHYGIVSLGGVIMNALKKVTEVETAGGGTVLVRSEQLRENKVLRALVEILGLDFTCRYEADAEVARLRYGAVIVATDQDLDGTGKILPLVLVWFHVFWPALIARGFVKRYMTPVIRAYPRGRGAPPREFFYEADFARWVAEQGGEAAVAAAGTAVRYYKGLASHDDGEVAAMFRAFAASVYTFTLDDEAARLFEVYFGERAALRKEALATPVAPLAPAAAAAIHASRRIPCSVQLEVDAKAYKLDDIQRKIPGAADGIPVARRKVLAGAVRRFAAAGGKEVKVFQLGGYVAEHMYYHHGDASLNGTIVSMAQRFPGALNFPFLTGVGQFGSRHFGGADAGSPRYISVRLAAPFARAVFPAEDTWLLPHVFEDGERAQPAYFLGVLPTPLLESFEIPSEGWRHRSFARDLGDVLRLTRAYVAGDPLVARAAAAAEAGTPASPADRAALAARFPLAVSLRGYGEHLAPAERAELVRPYRGRPHSFGWYHTEPAGRGGAVTVRVTELPLRKTTQAFLKDLEKPARAALIDEVDDYSSDTRVDVRVRLRPGAWETILEGFGAGDIDPVEDFLLLRSSLRPYLNYYASCGPRAGGVLEFGEDYHAVFFHWAPLRRDLYRARLEREAAVLALRVRLEREALRFIGAGLDLARVADEAEACAALAAAGFARFDAALLRAPRFAPTAALARDATEGAGAGYAYILDLKERDLNAAAAARRAARADEMAARLAEVEALLATEKPFAGAAAWAAEVEAAAAAIARGEATAWRFD